ncbi:protein RALF-like 9 [Vicia villosa]|uniref:protein RALF-like 9 n=1 Tax=Vicia villosa TaxID=3911 RepID=UPI00273BAA06|nr:protein RALF-like 9 [Vicia villosa]
MAMSKALVIMFLSSLLVFSYFVKDVEAGRQFIAYGAISRDKAPGCSAEHPEECKRQIANPYRRGCEKENHCHGDKVFMQTLRHKKNSKLMPFW